MKIRISSTGEGQILPYAKRELSGFLTQYSNHLVTEDLDAEREILLEYPGREGREDGLDYRITASEEGKKKLLTISGCSESGLLAGVYHVLEQMGLCFLMNGPVLNGTLDIAACDGMKEECRPFLQHRGIRQHINFPMDISSYHIEEAKEYIRNLARMGLNSITFHSYTGQWHGYVTENHTVYAGNYFYGQRHVVPDYPVISEHVSNRKYYCIPEVEEQLSDEKARHAFSIRWLNQLMEVCRQVGLQITMSIELPEDENTDNLVKIVRGVLESYPLIDTIEWISPEGGGSGAYFDLSGLTEKVRTYFGDAPFAGKGLPYVPERMPESLPGAMESLKRAVDLYERKDEILEGMGEKRIAIGLYVMCKETLKFLKHIMVSVLPKEVLFTFLPAHGSLAVANHIDFMQFTPEELSRTLIYSWIEFDGNMYLQQNSNKGIQAILERTAKITRGEPIYGICFNHWRTAENEVVAGYMAKASVSFETTRSFYGKYAKKLGIGETEVFTEAMELLEEIDCFNRDNLFNIGFCYLGCWLRPGLQWIRGWRREHMLEAQAMYQKVIGKLEVCLARTQSISGIAALRFFINRINCSMIQIQCILTLQPICEITDDENPEALNEEQKRWIEEQCDRALGVCSEYISLHMEQLLDRGCQGTAVSYYATLPVYVDHVKQYFVYGEKVCHHRPSTFDAPPPPDTAYLK